MPKAVDDGREDADELAAATGLTLSDLLTVSNAPNAPYFGPFGGPVFGSFGPGRFWEPSAARSSSAPSPGRRRVVGHRTRRTCRVPPFQVRQVTLTFAVQ